MQQEKCNRERPKASFDYSSVGKGFRTDHIDQWRKGEGKQLFQFRTSQKSDVVMKPYLLNSALPILV